MAYTTNITNARKDLYKLAEMALDQGAEININTKKGNVVLIFGRRVSWFAGDDLSVTRPSM